MVFVALVASLRLAYSVWPIAYGFQLYAISYQPYANFARFALSLFEQPANRGVSYCQTTQRCRKVRIDAC
jgi:hypothetical protein